MKTDDAMIEETEPMPFGDRRNNNPTFDTANKKFVCSLDCTSSGGAYTIDHADFGFGLYASTVAGCRVEEVRVLKGVGAFTSGFTAPSAAYGPAYP